MWGLPRRWLPLAVSFSTGLLLAAALLDLLPAALETGLTPHEAFPILLAGIIGFFLLEKFTLWRHAHTHDPAHGHSHDEQAPLILIGDAFHNFTDGVLIAAAFLADPLIGWSATLAVVAHEVPQEAGDFALLLAAGWAKRRALFWNGVSSLSALLGGLLGYLALDGARDGVPYALVLAAAGFLYIAIADLLPRLRRETSALPQHGALLACGIAMIALGGHSH
jgi:zinc and cadmium transporter